MAKAAKAAEVSAEILPVLPEDSKIVALDLAPIMKEDKSISITGNYDVVKAALEARRDEVMKMRVTDKNLDVVEKLRKEARGYRTYIAEYETCGKRRWFNAPKDIFAGKIATLQEIIADMESKAQKVLDKKEAERTTALTSLFDLYKEEFQAKYGLSEEGLALIEYKPGYYNKTAKEKDSKDDLEAQFIARRDVEKALALGEKTIRALCNGKPLLNVDKYISDLKNGIDLAIIMDDITTEEARLKDAQSTIEPEAVEAAPASAPGAFGGGAPSRVDPDVVSVGVIGVASRLLAGGSDFPGNTKSTIREITYPVDLGPALTEIFKELAKYGITTKVVKEAAF